MRGVGADRDRGRGITVPEMGRSRIGRAGIVIHEIRRAGVEERASWGWTGSDHWAA